MGQRWFICLLLLTLSCSVRLPEDDRSVDRVVFGLLGQTLVFPLPEGSWGVRVWEWPRDFAFNTKVSMLGEETDRTGLVLKNFGLADQGRRYSITTVGNAKPQITTYFNAVLATKIEVDVGATLTLRVTPEPPSWGDRTITWKYTPTCTTKATDFVEVLGHGTFQSRAHVDSTSGTLFVNDWKWRDDGFFTAVINGEKFAANYSVVSIVRVPRGHALLLDPDLGSLVGSINQFTWYRDNEPVVEFKAAGGVVYKFPHCATDNNDCDFDTRTGKLTVHTWKKSYDGVFTMMINGQLHKNGINVVGDVIFVPLVKNLVLDPLLDGDLTSIIWKHNGDFAAEYHAGDSGATYWLLCIDNCDLDTTTGKLTVKTWVPSRDKTFTVELNDRTKPYEYVVVKELDGYEASLTVQLIDTKQTRLTCAGYFDGAGPVKYWWRSSGTSNWVQGTNVMETKHVPFKPGRWVYEYDACKVENPVTERIIT